MLLVAEMQVFAMKDVTYSELAGRPDLFTVAIAPIACVQAKLINTARPGGSARGAQGDLRRTFAVRWECPNTYKMDGVDDPYFDVVS